MSIVMDDDDEPEDGKDGKRGKYTVPVNRGSQMSEHAILRSLGFSYDFTFDNVPIIYPGETIPTTGPYLQFRLLSGTNRGTFYIVDRLSVPEADLLGLSSYRYRKTTGCREWEAERAKNAFLTYVEIKMQRHLGVLLPVDIDWSGVLLHYVKFLDRGGQGLTRTSIRTFRMHVQRLAEFFGGHKLGEFDEDACLDYVEWRMTHQIGNLRNRDGSPRLVSKKQTQHELSTLRRAWKVYKRQKSVNYDVNVVCPAVDPPPFVYLTRYMLSRYLWAIRGRVWNVEKGRWRIARDDNPLLVGPEGNKRVLRPRRAIEARRSMGRLFLLGVYTGGRVGSILATTYDDKGHAHIDWDRQVLERRGLSERETSKRRPSVLIMPKLMRNIENWNRRDAEAGFTHLIHREDGRPYRNSFAPPRWRVLDEDAGLGIHVTAHSLRHTCAMLLKAGGVSLWVAADFMGTTTKVLEERYGTWDIATQHAAIAALSSGKCLRSIPLTTARRPERPARQKDPKGGKPTRH